ncbi:MAG: hypothetical protein JWM56_181 [Candidatus Peribacteria bacterium]|nr:hypothetical protein [Candidatus Peribacteria bacterium]
MLSSKEIAGSAYNELKDIEHVAVTDIIPSLGVDMEMETKVDIYDLPEVLRVMRALKSMNISDTALRSEEHHFFAHNADEHHALILVQGSSEVWIKSKRGQMPLLTPSDRIPVLLRQEKKLRPQSPEYFQAFHSVVNTPFIGSFQKDCLDVSFVHKDLVFTLTLSLAETKDGNQLFQFELELDGHLSETPMPNLQQILSEFERVARHILPVEAARFTTHQKIEWLLSMQAS